MSKYTTEVRYICEYYSNSAEHQDYSINDIINNSRAQIFGNYPIFDEAYRETLETKILKHYYTREICEETVGLWKLRLNSRMNEIMPFYNKLYSSELISFNPMYDVDLTTEHLRSEDTVGNSKSSSNDDRNEHRIGEIENNRESEETNQRTDNRTINENTERTNESNSTGNSTNSTNSNTKNSTQNSDIKVQKDKYSDTPQGGLTGIENDDYLTNVRIIDGNNTTMANASQEANANGENIYADKNTTKDNASSVNKENLNSKNVNSNNETNKSSSSDVFNSKFKSNKNDEHSINSTEDYLEHVHGKRGGISYAKMLMEYRESFLNIDKMIINDIDDLFFGLWE